ncbi:bifunctional metallophosphatase/5'-nucleotidase [Marinomonas balearica]|uniref:2',3'-cyclic-nucleotide 2'-phosphodiesterase (5'-nucleotidase family) n=1 Tax=Marinomonas balearica TaxID=491947 RepID=A0A4R6M2S8_9GAMM|nr:5'-nucleotidase C-terminal domain-containing protein [Marinomonas balearica]TDO95523.1 2',3'-cyclic-nucleotide 2'-phosphodiesterase (5'-nucleotidase family) [Marinomonas balearica]
MRSCLRDIKRVIFAIVFTSCALISTKSFSLTILFTSNIPNLFETDGAYSIGKLGSYIKSYRQQADDDVIFVHGGDSLFPNALSVYDNGVHMVDLLNVIGTDIFAVNQREFQQGVDQLTLRTFEAEFPMLQSNLIDERTGRHIEGTVDKYLYPTKEGIIGFVSVIDKTIKNIYLTRDVEVMSPIKTAKKLAQDLKRRGAKAVVLIAEHSALPTGLSELANDVDLVLFAEEAKDKIQDESVLSVSSGGADGEVAVIDWEIGKKPVAKIDSISNFEEDSELQASLSKYLGRLELILERELAVLQVDANTLKSNLRSGESALGNLFADAIREEVETDFAAINSGSIRGNREYHKGYRLKYKDIQTELPFGGSLYVLNVTRDELFTLMEHSVSRVDKRHGAFFQISGFEAQYDLSKPVGERVIKLTQNGEDLSPDNIYTLAVPDYIRYGGDSYRIREDQVVNKVSVRERLMWNIVSEYLDVNGKVAPKREGRLVDVSGLSLSEIKAKSQ